MINQFLFALMILLIIILLFIIIRIEKGPFLFSKHRNSRNSRNSPGTRRSRKHRKSAEPEQLERRRPCPLCATMGQKTDRIHGVNYIQEDGNKYKSRMEVEEILTHVFGCPACWPVNPEHPRICPVCRQTLSADGFLVARTFRRKGKKDHVHVLGCTECKRVR